MVLESKSKTFPLDKLRPKIKHYQTRMSTFKGVDHVKQTYLYKGFIYFAHDINEY